MASEVGVPPTAIIAKTPTLRSKINLDHDGAVYLLGQLSATDIERFASCKHGSAASGRLPNNRAVCCARVLGSEVEGSCREIVLPVVHYDRDATCQNDGWVVSGLRVL